MICSRAFRSDLLPPTGQAENHLVSGYSSRPFGRGFTTAYNLVLGQAKNFVAFSEEEIRRIGELAQKFAKRPYLAFSTLKDAFSEEEKRLLSALVAQGHKLIALTRLELDPYHLYTRFEGAPHRYAHSLNDLFENTLHLNVGRDPAA